ncbi:lactate 2-monooxygenase [Halorarius halobius]|uniref:lactate 2-monooxygenase n=1 Tax=Halorarius halobius TaxID=2962671 RepID=UPI0020CC0D3B|nr:lactate 2-monooxygenase [Halorarius halobius]
MPEDTHGEQFGVKHIREVYRKGMYEGETPDFPVSFEELRAEAFERMDETAKAYVHGGAGSEETFERNKDFSAWRIVPRMLRGVADRDLSVELYGRTHEYPVMITPLGVQSLLHEEAEGGTARACKEMDVPFILSSLSSTPMEEVAEELGDTPKWFQFYWSTDRDVAASFLDRAEESGYDAIVLTVDAPTLGWRERLLERGYYPFLDGEGVANYFSDPAFRSKLDAPPEEDPQAAVDLFLEIFGDASLTWDDLQFLHDSTDLPVIVKGILHPDDARLAIEHGADGVGVSTHGGRQVDGSITAFEALPDVADEVDGEVPVFFDSGIRRGEHTFKALALGADTVLLGRPFAYGLAHSGQSGVENVLRNHISQLDLTMGLAGIDDVEAIDRAAVKHERDL